MPRRRLGVVLLVPPPVDREVDGLRRATGDPALGRVPPHLTLVPPVNVREDAMDAPLAVLREAAAATAPLTLILGPPATFLPDNPVLYLSVGGPDLDRLGRLRDAVFVPPFERRLDWPFVPHVTLADGIAEDRIAHALAALADYRAEIVVDRIDVLEQGEDRSWRPIADVAFEGRSVIGRGGLELELTSSERLDPEAGAWLAAQWTAEHARTGTSDAVSLTVTARRDGRVVAVATGWTRGTLANLSDLIVDPAARREGVAGHAVARFLADAAARGVRLCRLRADAGTPAEAFSRERGWTEEARYPGPEPGLDIVQLVRHLAHPGASSSFWRK